MKVFFFYYVWIVASTGSPLLSTSLTGPTPLQMQNDAAVGMGREEAFAKWDGNE